MPLVFVEQPVAFQVRHDAAECIPVHTKFARSLALVAFVIAQDFLEIPAAKLADSLLVGDATGVHLYDKNIQFAFHLMTSLTRLANAAAVNVPGSEKCFKKVYSMF